MMDITFSRREIMMKCVLRYIQTWVVVTLALMVMSLMLLQSMVQHVAQNQQTMYFSDIRGQVFQKRVLGSYNKDRKVKEFEREDVWEGWTSSGKKRDDKLLDNDYDNDEETDGNEFEREDTSNDNFPNPTFGDRDFDPIEHYTKPKFQMEEISKTDNKLLHKHFSSRSEYTPKPNIRLKSLIHREMQIKNLNPVHGNKTKIKFISQHAPFGYTDGLFWSEEVEHLIPKGPSFADIEGAIGISQKMQVAKLEPAGWDNCGRVKNGFVTMTDGSQYCARYRSPHQNLVLGEVLSFYLSRLLGMDNVPLVVLSNTSSHQFSQVNFTKLDWEPETIVALIKWIDGINTFNSRVFMPNQIYKAILNNKTVGPRDITNQDLSKDQVLEIVQWGDMMIFDYITGNYDRVASMQDAATEENRISALSESIRNLRKHKDTSKYWLIDNESGLFDAYDLLYKSYSGGPKFKLFHQQTLQSLCIFRKSTIKYLRKLYTHKKPDKLLLSYARKYEPLFDQIHKNWLFDVFLENFPKRIGDVYSWFEKCKNRIR